MPTWMSKVEVSSQPEQTMIITILWYYELHPTIFLGQKSVGVSVVLTLLNCSM